MYNGECQLLTTSSITRSIKSQKYTPYLLLRKERGSGEATTPQKNRKRYPVQQLTAMEGVQKGSIPGGIKVMGVDNGVTESYSTTKAMLIKRKYVHTMSPVRNTRSTCPWHMPTLLERGTVKLCQK